MAVSPKWSPAEERYARQLRSRGKSYREIAKRLGRTEAAVCQYLNTNKGECFISSMRRSRFNYQVGALYEISTVYCNSSSLYFLPAKFVFLGRLPGINKRPDHYCFRSVLGGYTISFTMPQILGAYIIQRIKPRIKGDKKWTRRGGNVSCTISFRGWRDGKVREVPCPLLTN